MQVEGMARPYRQDVEPDNLVLDSAKSGIGPQGSLHPGFGYLGGPESRPHHEQDELLGEIRGANRFDGAIAIHKAFRLAIRTIHNYSAKQPEKLLPLSVIWIGPGSGGGECVAQRSAIRPCLCGGDSGKTGYFETRGFISVVD